jgi:hypothetical protein
MSNQESEHIRVRVLEVIEGSKPGRCRYPKDLKEASVTYAKRRRSEGATVKVICQELGLRHWTLHKWLRSSQERFLPVKVTNTIGTPKSVHEAGNPVLTTPGGYRVDGLHVKELLFLLHHLDR